MAAAGGLLWAAMVAGCLAMGLGCTTTLEDRGGTGRATLGAPCTFPFTYKGITYTSCTNRTDPEGLLWCSTQVDSEGNHVRGNFGYCASDCITEEADEDDDDNEFDNNVNTEEEADVSVRSSPRYGEPCFSSAGYSGSCRKVQYCRRSSYAYSRTCGWSLVCCKRSPNRRSKATRKQPERWWSKPSTTERTITTTTKKPLPKAPLCGLEGTSPFVFGGQEAKPGQFPFMVSFVYTDQSKVENFCGGALITSRHVLTAAHCFRSRRPSDWRAGGLLDIRIGLSNLQDKESSPANIKDVTLHPRYQELAGGKEGVKNDFAIVTLDRDVRAPQVCLGGERSPGSKAVVLGFGKTVRSKVRGEQQDKLRFAYLEEIDTEECQRKYSNFYRGSRYEPRITEEMLCAGNDQADACSGDSGSPLLYLNTQLRWMVAGVVSFGPSSCGNKAPGVYARVSSGLDWIQGFIAD